MDSITVDFEKLGMIMPNVLLAGYPVMLRGPHGIGKSEVVKELRNKIFWDTEKEEHILLRNIPDPTNNICTWNDYRSGNGKRFVRMSIVERRAANMTEGDMLGLPTKDGQLINGERASKFTPFDWMTQICTEPAIFFADEIDRGSPEVGMGFFEMTDSRKVAGQHLHKGTLIVAAVNGGERGGHNYTVNDLDPAGLDRWTVYDVEPSVTDWLNWARFSKRVHKSIIDFISENPDMLEYNLNKTRTLDPIKVQPSRRSWVRFSDTLTKAGFLNEPKKYGEEIHYIGLGFVGVDSVVAFRSYVNDYVVGINMDMFFNDNLETRREVYHDKESGEDLEYTVISNIYDGKFDMSVLVKLIDDIEGASIFSRQNELGETESYDLIANEGEVGEDKCMRMAWLFNSVPAELKPRIFKIFADGTTTENHANLETWYRAVEQGGMYKFVDQCMADESIIDSANNN